MAHNDARYSGESAPIWLDALLATGCRAVSDRECQPIGWRCVAGRAVYTNLNFHRVEIHPLGITIERGETLSVTWEPGETKYTLDVHRPDALCS
jgi:hypothetical protein